MAKGNYLVGVDLGTHSIKVLVAARKGNENLEVVSQLEVEGAGMRKGVVISPEEVSSALRDIFKKIKEETQNSINSVYVNVGGSHLFTGSSHGLISVSRADRKISEEDVQRVLQEAQAISLSSNKRIFDAVAREFIVDGEGGIKEPLGLEGVRLEADVLVLGGFVPYLENLTQSVLNSGLEISDMIPSGVAAAESCLTKKQKELGSALVDIGAGTTALAVFEEGSLIHLAVLPMGSGNITNDIAIGLKCDNDIAEKIKIEYGSCLGKKSQKKEKIEIGEEDPLVFSQNQLGHIIETRVSEIFAEIDRELKKISKEKSLPGGVVIAGGGAKIQGIANVAKKSIKLAIKIGKPQGVEGISDIAFSTVCGLVLSGANSQDQEKQGPLPGVMGKLKKVFKIFNP